MARAWQLQTCMEIVSLYNGVERKLNPMQKEKIAADYAKTPCTSFGAPQIPNKD